MPARGEIAPAPLAQLHTQDFPELVAPLCYFHAFPNTKSERQPPPTLLQTGVHLQGAKAARVLPLPPHAIFTGKRWLSPG